MIDFDSTIFPIVKGVYLVGGCVRDFLLGKQPFDFDIAVIRNPEGYADLLAAHLDGHWVKIGKPGQTILRVVSEDRFFDISPANGTCIEDDLRQRDFTVNALAYDLYAKKIIDATGGLHDLDQKKIRSVSSRAFQKDPVRLIRAFRLAATLDFVVEARTLSAITRDAPLVRATAGERIRAEVLKMFGAPHSHERLCQMADTGLLTAIFPELERLRGCSQNRYHRFDAFEHSLRAFCHLETLISGRPKSLSPSLERIISELDPDKTALLKYAILLHDIGKPAVRSTDPQGRVRFHGHAGKSADMAVDIARRLRLSVQEEKFVDFIIRNHIRPLSLFIARENRTLSPKGKTRFFVRCGGNTPYLLVHSLADTLAKQDHPGTKNDPLIDFLTGWAIDFFSEFSPRTKIPPLVTGRDLIDLFGLPPSPRFKKILKTVEEARLSNALQTRTEALRLVGELLSQDQGG